MRQPESGKQSENVTSISTVQAPQLDGYSLLDPTRYWGQDEASENKTAIC